MFILNEDPPSKKRRRESSELPPEDTLSVKRGKHTPEVKPYRWHRPPSFWNRLSKVHLSRGALKEFDRRTSRAELPVLTPGPIDNTSSGPGTESVKRFSRHGGPDLTHIRGFAILADQEDTMSQSNSSRKRSSASRGSDATRKSKSSYDPNFEQNLIDGGIYPDGYGPDETSTPIKPRNMDDLQTAMRAPRQSLSPSRFTDTDFEEFVRKVKRSGDEATARAEIMSIIAGDSRRNHYSASDRQFNHLEPLADDLPQPKPDLYDGAIPQQIDRRARRDLGKQIVPCNNTSLPAAPNFFLEGKSEGGRADVAKRQACHDGAVGARAMHYLQNYQVAEPYQVAKPTYDGNAYSYSSTYHHGTSTLKLYSHHLTAPKAPGEPPEYHMTQLKGFDMTSDKEAFVRGASGYRNNRDRAKTNRDNFIDHANQIARRVPTTGSPSNTFTDTRSSLSVHQEDESDTSPDELAAEQSTTKRTRYAAFENSRHAPMPAGSHSSAPLNQAKQS